MKLWVIFLCQYLYFLSENKLSKSKIQKIDGFDKNRKCLYFFLIGQLGLDDKYLKTTLKTDNLKFSLGDLLLSYAIDKIKQAQTIIAGRYILVDAITHDKVINFYKSNGFEILLQNQTTTKMIKKLF